MNFWTFILVTILIFWLLGIVGRTAFGIWLHRRQRRFAGEFGGAQQGRNARRAAERREGYVSIRKTAFEEKTVNKNVGDYVEFEEIETTEER